MWIEQCITAHYTTPGLAEAHTKRLLFETRWTMLGQRHVAQARRGMDEVLTGTLHTQGGTAGDVVAGWLDASTRVGRLVHVHSSVQVVDLGGKQGLELRSGP